MAQFQEGSFGSEWVGPVASGPMMRQMAVSMWRQIIMEDGMWRQIVMEDSMWRQVIMEDSMWRQVVMEDGMWRQTVCDRAKLLTT